MNLAVAWISQCDFPLSFKYINVKSEPSTNHVRNCKHRVQFTMYIKTLNVVAYIYIYMYYV